MHILCYCWQLKPCLVNIFPLASENLQLNFQLLSINQTQRANNISFICLLSHMLVLHQSRCTLQIMFAQIPWWTNSLSVIFFSKGFDLTNHVTIDRTIAFDVMSVELSNVHQTVWTLYIAVVCQPNPNTYTASNNVSLLLHTNMHLWKRNFVLS